MLAGSISNLKRFEYTVVEIPVVGGNGAAIAVALVRLGAWLRLSLGVSNLLTDAGLLACGFDSPDVSLSLPFLPGSP